MISTTSCLVLLMCWSAKGAVVPEGPQYNLPASDTPNEGRGRQLFFLQPSGYNNQYTPQLQRLELTDNPDAVYFHPSQQKDEAASANRVQNSKSSAQSAKLETLEPDAELIPGAQLDPQKPPTQVPVATPGLPGLPGLGPGRVYIVHPQHQLYPQNTIYAHLPNGFRPNIQLPGYQRFYIINAAPTVPNGNFAPQAGYQNAILVDPSAQGLGFGGVQSLYQRLVGQGPEQSAQQYPGAGPEQAGRQYFSAQPQQSSQQNSGTGPEQALQQYSGPDQASQLYLGAGPEQTNQQFAGPPQFAPALAGAPPAALPFFGFGRQAELPYQPNGIRSDYQLGPNAVQFSQLLSLHPGPAQARKVAPSDPASSPSGPVSTSAASAPTAPPAQGRIDEQSDEYTDDYSSTKKDDDVSTEANNFEESVKTTRGKEVPAPPPEPKDLEAKKTEKRSQSEDSASVQISGESDS